MLCRRKYYLHQQISSFINDNFSESFSFKIIFKATFSPEICWKMVLTERTSKKLYCLPLTFDKLSKFLSNLSLSSYQSFFPLKDSQYQHQPVISTIASPFLLDQSECFHLFLVSYWQNVLLFMVPGGRVQLWL